MYLVLSKARPNEITFVIMLYIKKHIEICTHALLNKKEHEYMLAYET